MFLKSLEEILQPDDRHNDFVRYNPTSGECRQISMADYHAWMADAALPDNVPAKIREQFDKARFAFIFCWFEYELSSLAEQHAYATLVTWVANNINNSLGAMEAERCEGDLLSRST
jgi:hypothetical protein